MWDVWLIGAVLVTVVVWGLRRDPRRPGDRTGGVDHDAIQRAREDIDARNAPPQIPPSSY
jgi:hypothetical protein